MAADRRTEMLAVVTPEGMLTLETREQGLRRDRALVRKYIPERVSLSRELIADRRAEAGSESKPAFVGAGGTGEIRHVHRDGRQRSGRRPDNGREAGWGLEPAGYAGDFDLYHVTRCQPLAEDKPIIRHTSGAR